MHVRKPPPYQSFPLDALPDPIAEFIRQGAKALGCDPAYLALPILAGLGSAIGNTRTIALKRGWHELSVVWAAIIGDSGTLKSPAFQLVLRPFRQRQLQLLCEYREKLAKFQEEDRAYQAAKRAKEKSNTTTIAPVEPVFQRVLVNDTTIEQLALILEENARGIFLARDELAGWLSSFTRYKGKGAGSDVPTWLEFFRAGSTIIDRKTGDRRNIYIERGAVSVTGSIQPGVLARALTPDLFDAGLPARLLMAMPPKKPKRWCEDEIGPATEHAYQDIVNKLLGLDFDTSKGDKEPHVLVLSHKAKSAWVQFYDDWAQRQSCAEGELAASLSKLEAYAARFAMLHHVISHIARGEDDLVPVGQDSIEAGVILCKWFAAEHTRIYSILTESSTENTVRRLIEWIESQGGRVTARALQHSNSRKYPTIIAATGALDELVKAGFGQWDVHPSDSKGGRPTRDFILSQSNDTTDNTYTTPYRHSGMDGVSPPKSLYACNGIAAKPAQCRVSSVTSVVGTKGNAPKNQLKPEVQGSAIIGVLSDTSPPTVVKDESGLKDVISALNNTTMVGLDVETTGLDPHLDKTRLLSLACKSTDGTIHTYVIDCFVLDPSPLWCTLAQRELVIHNAAFDLAFLDKLGFAPNNKVHDTMLLAQLINAGTKQKARLVDCCQKWLGQVLDKTEQKSDWSGQLTANQLAYAAEDTRVLIPLFQILTAKIKEAGLVEVAAIEQQCLPALIWTARQGVPFNKEAWQALAHTATNEAVQLIEQLNENAPKLDGICKPWNWNSTKQVLQALNLAGCSLTGTNDNTLSSIDHPLAQLLRRYRHASKRSSTYGSEWLIKYVADDGRIYPRWRQLGAETGRMSCSQPNMQQLPRGDYRRCIEAPTGRLLLKADYSQIELRIAAMVSGDPALLRAYQNGEDLHIRTAQGVLGIVDVTPEHRQLAKALNFGLLYGMGAKRFQLYAKNQYGLNLTLDQARQYREAFFKAYPGLAAWHQHVRSQRKMQSRTLCGRRRLFDWESKDTERLNTPVQGTGADGIKLALALLWERRNQVPGAFPVLVVHDEIVVECDIGQAALASAWLKSAMEEAMSKLITPVPVVVEIKSCTTWGGDLT